MNSNKQKKKTKNIINELNAMKNRVSGTFQGRTREEMIESINLLQNRCRDLSEDLQNFRTSLEELQDDVHQEEKR